MHKQCVPQLPRISGFCMTLVKIVGYDVLWVLLRGYLIFSLTYHNFSSVLATGLPLDQIISLWYQCNVHSYHNNSLPLLCVAMLRKALKELLTSHFIPLTVYLLLSIFLFSVILLTFCSQTTCPFSLLLYSFCLLFPSQSLLSASAMKWQLRGCQCGFSSLLILFQRDV